MSAVYEVGEGYASGLNQSAIDLIPGDLSGQGVQAVHVYYYDADDHAVPYAERLDIYAGFYNGSAADYIDVQAMVSHGGMRDSGIIVDAGSAALQNKILLSDYVRFHGFCVKQSSWLAGANNYLFYLAGTAGTACRIYDNLIYDLQCDVGKYIMAVRVQSISVIMYNNQLFNIGNITGDGLALFLNVAGSAGQPHLIHNNIALNCSLEGFDGENVDYVYMSNNYCSNFSWFTNIHNQINYNISADGTADDNGGTGNLINKAAADQFECITSGKENLNLKPMSVCNRKGQDNSALFTTDCAGNDWTHWETGALAAVYDEKNYGDDNVIVNGVPQ